MSTGTKRIVTVVLSVALVASLVLVQAQELVRRRRQAGLQRPELVVPARSQPCVECHGADRPGVVEPWQASTHARQGVACVDCHQAEVGEADSYEHYGERLATLVTPRDCGRCHPAEAELFARSRHAAAADLSGAVELAMARVARAGDGQAVAAGCAACHGSTVAVLSTAGERITVDDLQPDAQGKPTARALVAEVARDADGFVTLDRASWPNAGVGRRNLDGSRGACSACHGRHDFSAYGARRPASCTRCHLGADQPQKEIYEASKHGARWLAAAGRRSLASDRWVLGQDYAAAPSCATCHLSGHTRNGGAITHDPAERLSWTHRPVTSQRMDTNADGERETGAEQAPGRAAVADTWQDKRKRMREVCLHCHVGSSVDGFYAQYDEVVARYAREFAEPATVIMAALVEQGLRTERLFDEPIEWTWFELWHRAGRSMRMGAAMMSPAHAQGRGRSEVARQFHGELVPQARALARTAAQLGRGSEAEAVRRAVDDALR